MRNIHIGLLGFGSVGKELAHYLIKEQDTLRNRTKCEIFLKKIFTRNPQKIVNAGMQSSYIAQSWQSLIEDPTINCIVELIGGVENAKEYIISALSAGKDVVTANKAVLAEHGKELWSIARKNNVCIAFEASCGGGIPIIRALTDGLIANKISALFGVLNGSCNFILSEMDKKKISFEEALDKAIALGLVEADPGLDIEGIDTAHKIAIMSSLAYNTTINFNLLPKTGISNIKTIDIQFGKKLGYTTKLIAAGVALKDTISIWVHPAFLANNHPLSSVEGPFNAISVVGNKVGHTMYSGRGAGGSATASAVIADLVGIANGSCKQIFDSITLSPDTNTQSLQDDMKQFICPVYIRIFVHDQVGVLSSIASILAKHSISIARVLQEDYPHSEYIEQKGLATLIIITHNTHWNNIEHAKQELATLDILYSPPVYYPIIQAVEEE